MHSDMIAKKIEVSITKTYLKKPRLYRVVYEWTDSGGIINNYGTFFNFIFKIINPSTSIVVSNLKD